MSQYADLATSEAGLLVVDVSTPAAPVVIGFCDTPGRAVGVAVDRGYAYVADYVGGLRVSTPSAPIEVGYYYPPDGAYDVAVDGGYTYVAAEGAGLRVVDVSIPSAPSEVGVYDASGSAHGVYPWQGRMPTWPTPPAGCCNYSSLRTKPTCRWWCKAGHSG